MNRLTAGLVAVASLSLFVVPALGAPASAAPVVSVPGPHYQSALSPPDIARLSANPTDRVIVLLRDQHPELPGTVIGRSARAARLAGDQRSISSELRTLKVPRLQDYSFVNAIAATMSKAEADRLSTNPSVLAVVPDSLVQGPSVTPDAGSAPVAPPATGTPAGVCPSNPAKPILEPEALQLMNVDFGPGSTQPAAHDLATGKGVKVAVFPDGLDPNIPDFIRNGKSAIFDYQDFTGEGLGAVTGAEEAFGDASSFISQGTQTFDLSGEVNPAHPLPPGCNIQIKGVAPDADLAVMKVFGNSNFAFNSEILTGIEYAILHDHVDILSQSFGGNPVPNPGLDPIAIIDAEAAAAGITVVVSSGDAGTTNTIGTPATNPGVISVGATTSYRLYAQTTSYGYQFGGNGWVSDDVSAFSSSGNTEFGPRTIDVVAPGESGWADCSTNTAVFTECADIYHGANPQPIVAFGGTSQSCPLTAATAALVIQAYRDTHNGATPSPQLVKQIIMSTAQDLGVRADNQGAGLVDALRAVQEARSIGTTSRSGDGLLYSRNSLSSVAQPGASTTNSISVTNTGAGAQTVSPAVRVLGAATTLASGTFQINQATDPTFVYQTGAVLGGVHLVHFTVPGGVDRLVGRIAWDTSSQPSATVRASYFDPQGRIVSQSRPQGAGGGFGEDEIRNPTPGTWTLLTFNSVPYTGPLTFTITGADFHDVPGAVSPASQTIQPGASATFRVTTTTPSAPGDLAEAVTFATSGGTAEGTIPIILRALVPLPGGAGSFSGELTGGNARMAFYGQELVYQFDVPRNVNDLDVDVNVGSPGYQVFGFLVQPDALPADVQSTIYTDQSSPTGDTVNLQTMHFSWTDPAPGRWSLDLTQINGISSVRTSTPISGTIRFNTVKVSSSGLPSNFGTRLPKGQPTTATIHVVNTGNSPEAYAVDPRLDETSQLSLSSLVPTTDIPLPVTDGSTIPQFVVPPFSTRLDMAAISTVPINFDPSPAWGWPEVTSVSHGNSAVATIIGADLPASIYSCPPSEIGPFATTGTDTTFSCGAAAVTNTFDLAVDSSTGNVWSALEGLTNRFSPLVLQPGQAGDITVAITPTANSGTKVSGFLAVDTWNPNTISSDQLVNIPYRYRVG
jgi:hypothetical protein